MYQRERNGEEYHADYNGINGIIEMVWVGEAFRHRSRNAPTTNDVSRADRNVFNQVACASLWIELYCYDTRSDDSGTPATESIFVTICTHLECKSHFMTWKFYSSRFSPFIACREVNHTSATADVTSKYIEAEEKSFSSRFECLRHRLFLPAAHMTPDVILGNKNWKFNESTAAQSEKN